MAKAPIQWGYSLRLLLWAWMGYALVAFSMHYMSSVYYLSYAAASLWVLWGMQWPWAVLLLASMPAGASLLRRGKHLIRAGIVCGFLPAVLGQSESLDNETTKVLLLGVGLLCIYLAHIEQWFSEPQDVCELYIWAFLLGAVLHVVSRYHSYSFDRFLSSSAWSIAAIFITALCCILQGYADYADSQQRRSESKQPLLDIEYRPRTLLYNSISNRIVEGAVARSSRLEADITFTSRLLCYDAVAGAAFGSSLFLLLRTIGGHSIVSTWSQTSVFPTFHFCIISFAVGSMLGGSPVMKHILALLVGIVGLAVFSLCNSIASLTGACFFLLVLPSFFFLVFSRIQRTSKPLFVGPALVMLWILSIIDLFSFDPRFAHLALFGNPMVSLWIAMIPIIAFHLLVFSFIERIPSSFHVPSKTFVFVLFIFVGIIPMPSTMRRAKGFAPAPKKHALVPMYPIGFALSPTWTVKSTTDLVRPFTAGQISLRQGQGAYGRLDIDAMLASMSKEHYNMKALCIRDIETMSLWTGCIDLPELIAFRMRMNVVAAQSPRDKRQGLAILTPAPLTEHTQRMYSKTKDALFVSVRLPRSHTLVPTHIIALLDSYSSRGSESDELMQQLSRMDRSESFIIMSDMASSRHMQKGLAIHHNISSSVTECDNESQMAQVHRNVVIEETTCESPADLLARPPQLQMTRFHL